MVKEFEVYQDMCNPFDRIPACDRQTDGQTYTLRRHGPRYAQHGAVKIERRRRTFCRRLAAVHDDIMNSNSETSIDRPSPAIKM